MTRRPDWAWGCWLLVGVPLFLLLVGVPAHLLANSTGLWQQLNTGPAREAMVLSLWTTGLTLLLVIVFGTPLAFAVARTKFPFKRLVDALIDLPLVLPPAAAGIGLLLLFGKNGVPGAWLAARGISLVFTPAAVVLAQLFVASPFYVRAAVIAFGGMDREVEQSAELDGADKLTTFGRVTLPIVRRGLAAGAATCWARALGEFGATLLFAGNFPGTTQTMPLAVYAGFESDLSSAIAMSCVLLVVALVVLLVAKLADR